MMTKVKCLECSWTGNSEDVRVHENPFAPETDITGCPQCSAVNTCELVCDEPDCWQLVSCGTLTNTGYRQTCGKHRPEL